jgi:hypothetical protein
MLVYQRVIWVMVIHEFSMGILMMVIETPIKWIDDHPPNAG